MAEKHQLLQAYINAGVLFGNTIQMEKSIKFYIEHFSSKIQTAVQSKFLTTEDILLSVKSRLTTFCIKKVMC